MRRFVWQPAFESQIGHGPRRSLVGRPGDVVELDEESARYHLEHVAGANGGPCLVPVPEPGEATIDQPVRQKAPRRRREG